MYFEIPSNSKVYNRKTRTRGEICSKWTMISLLLSSNKFTPCFSVSLLHFEQVNSSCIHSLVNLSPIRMQLHQKRTATWCYQYYEKISEQLFHLQVTGSSVCIFLTSHAANIIYSSISDWWTKRLCQAYWKIYLIFKLLTSFWIHFI